MSLGTFAGNLCRDSVQEEQGSELLLLGVDASPESSLVTMGTAHSVEYEGCRQGAGMVVVAELSTCLESWPCLGRSLAIQLLTVPLSAGHPPSTSVEGSSCDSAPSLPLLPCSSRVFLAQPVLQSLSGLCAGGVCRIGTCLHLSFMLGFSWLLTPLRSVG